ncbi:MAG: hypothetical protein AAF517_24545 [Planctomycetota bacterium]
MTNLSDCNLDTVIEMEELDVGPAEILQFAKGMLSRDEIRCLVEGLSAQLNAATPTELVTEREPVATVS